MPKLGLGLGLPTTRVLDGFNPTSIPGLKLWYDAGQGVTETSQSYVSQIVLSGAGDSTSDGTYTRASGGFTQLNDATTGNYIVWDPNFPAWVLFDVTLGYVTYLNGNPNLAPSWSVYIGNSPEPAATNTSSSTQVVASWADQSGTEPYILGGELPMFYAGVVNGKSSYQNPFGDFLSGISVEWVIGGPLGTGWYYYSTTGGTGFSFDYSSSNTAEPWDATWGSSTFTSGTWDAISVSVSPALLSSGINGKPAIDFSNGAWLQIPRNNIGGDNAAINPYAELSLFVVLDYSSGSIILNKGDASTYEATVWELAPGNGFGFVNDPFYSASWKTAPVSLSTGIQLVEGFTNNGVSQLAINGADVGSPSDQATIINYLTQYIGIGGGGTSGGSVTPLDAKVAEILIYNRNVTSGERAKIEEYLNGKYAIY